MKRCLQSGQEQPAKSRQRGNASKGCDEAMLRAYFDAKDVVFYQEKATGAWHEATVEGFDADSDGKPVFRVRNRLTEEAVSVGLDRLVPARGTQLAARDLTEGLMLLAYLVKPNNERGWYKMQLTRVENSSIPRVFATVFFSSELQAENQYLLFVHNTVVFPELVPREQWSKNDNIASLDKPCDECMGNPGVRCRQCSCVKCSRKPSGLAKVVCTECGKIYHESCAKLNSGTNHRINWLCENCGRIEEEARVLFEGNEPVVQIGKVSITNMIVPEDHFGKVPGVPTGRLWASLDDVCAWGVHRSVNTWICGAINVGVQSICLLEGLEGDQDIGYEIIVVGNRDSNNSHAKLTGLDLALAQSCYASLNLTVGAVSTNWRKGMQIRLVRGPKFGNVSEYAPREGYRYEGIYKVRRYFLHEQVWKFELKRDDNEPPAWSSSGLAFMKSLGVGHLEVPAGGITSVQEAYKLPPAVSALAKKDALNRRHWEDLERSFEHGFVAFGKKFSCCFCKKTVKTPTTFFCGHSSCMGCAQQLLLKKGECHPCCKDSVRAQGLKANHLLGEAIDHLMPGYNPKKAPPKPLSLLVKTKK